MHTQPFTLDWKSIFEAIHAGGTVIIPVLVTIAYFFRNKFRAFMSKEVGAALKTEFHDEIKGTVEDVFEDKTETFQRICKDANDELLVRINGTYVRSREQRIIDEHTKERLDRIETKVDTIATHFAK